LNVAPTIGAIIKETLYISYSHSMISFKRKKERLTRVSGALFDNLIFLQFTKFGLDGIDYPILEIVVKLYYLKGAMLFTPMFRRK